MDTSNAPQIVEHIHQSVPYTPFEARWIPGTAKFVVVGQNPRATGCIKVYELDKGKLKTVHDAEKTSGFKAATFAASPPDSALLTTGDYAGMVHIWDIEHSSQPVWSVKGHDGIINAVDGCGGLNIGYGAPEIVTGGRDGCVRVWDPRQKDAVLSLEPVEGETPADCWAVAFGNSFNEHERCICAGYDNGDLKVFDLRTTTLKWDTNVKNGICHVSFDRKDIQMNKLAVSTLEQKLIMYDMRTYNVDEGYAGRTEKVHKSTVWGCHFLPQNRELFATTGGNGQLNIYKYSYPKQRSIKLEGGQEKGVPGSLELLNQKELSSQPIVSFDWHLDKVGLCCMAALDQAIRVAIVTKLNLY